MVNAIQVGMDFHAALPDFDRPEKTQDREGFFHLYDFQGTVDHTEMGYIIRDHDRDRFEARKRLFKGIANQMNSDFGEDRVKVTLKDQYYNMGEVIKKDPTPRQDRGTGHEECRRKTACVPGSWRNGRL